MRRAKPILIAVAAGLAWTGAGSAQVSEPSAISSATPGALDVPERWDCRRIKPEYSDWLDAGNSPQSWRHAGKTFRDAETGKTYTWQDWLDWAEDAGCFAGYVPTAGAVQQAPLITGAITAFGASLVAIHRGSRPKSPG